MSAGRGAHRRAGRSRRSDGECGNMAPLVVAAAFVLFAALAFSVDQGIAYATKARQENALDAARSACMDASFALRAKNDDDPAARFAERTVRAVRDAGCAGSVSVWFYEAPETDVAEGERVWAVGLQVEEESPTVFARGFGVEGNTGRLPSRDDGRALCRGSRVASRRADVRALRRRRGPRCG